MDKEEEKTFEELRKDYWAEKDKAREFLKALREAMVVPCCHTSGMHDPSHFDEKRYICEEQKAEAFDKLCKLLGVKTQNALSKKDCGWCKNYPDVGTTELKYETRIESLSEKLKKIEADFDKWTL